VPWVLNHGWSLCAERVLTSRRRGDESIRSAFLMARAQHVHDAHERSVIVKFLGANWDAAASDSGGDELEPFSTFMKREARIAELMSLFVTLRIAPGLMLTYATVTDATTLGLPVHAGATPWTTVNDILRGPDCDERPPQETYMAAIVSEFVDGGLAVNTLPALAAATPHAGASVVASLYGQLQWTLAAVHGIGLVHADVQVENLVVRYVPPEPDTRFTLPGSGDLTYRFLAGSTERVPLLKLIDYGITDGNNTPLCYCPTSRFSRAPEFFVGFNPVRPDRRLTASTLTHLRPSADIWSAAMSFLTILCGGLVPGHASRLRNCHNVQYATGTPPDSVAFRSPVSSSDAAGIWTPPRGFVTAVISQINAWERLPRGQRCADEMARLRQESAEVLATEMWRLAMLLGLPSVQQWPDSEHMPFLALLRNYNVRRLIPDAPDDCTVLAPHARRIFYAALDQYAPTMPVEKRAALERLLARQLQWNPMQRLRAREALADPALKLLCDASADAGACRPGMTWTLNLNHLTGRLTDPNPGHALIAAAERLHVDIGLNRL
jgi:serine/threonine protein kinase